MKKVILALIIFVISFGMNVYAEECRDWEIEEADEALKDLTFDIQYADDFKDMNGDPATGFFKVFFPNLPEAYYIIVDTNRGDYTINNSSELVYSTGGVIKVQVLSKNCDTVLKSFEAKVPFYKQYCTLNSNCDKDIWFDGTFENTATNVEQENKKSTSFVLIILLVILIIILSIAIILIIRKRRYDAQDF